MTTCRYPDCKAKVAEGIAFCDSHRLRWHPGRPVEPEQTSPWVRRALAHRLPGKVFGA